MPRLRILHIITKLELGGAQQNTLYTVKNLDKAKFEVGLIAGPGGILDSEAKSDQEAQTNSRQSIAHEYPVEGAVNAEGPERSFRPPSGSIAR